MNYSQNNNGNGMNSQNNTSSCIKNLDGSYSYQDGTPCQPSYLESFKSYFGYGGKRRTVRRGGGFRPYTDINVASTASRFSGGRTAQPHNWTGGKRRRSSAKRSLKCKKCSKRRRHRH